MGLMLPEANLNEYLAKASDNQNRCIRQVRDWILAAYPQAKEEIDTGKWFGGLLTFSTPGGFFLYALGPRRADHTTLHMMPYYGAAELQAKWGPSLKKLMTGKSCMEFRTQEEIPEDALKDIFGYTETFIAQWEKMAAEKAAKKKKSQSKSES